MRWNFNVDDVLSGACLLVGGVRDLEGKAERASDPTRLLQGVEQRAVHKVGVLIGGMQGRIVAYWFT